MGSNKALWPFAIMLFLLLPSILIWPQQGHDWGDDFAMYIIQAQELIGRWGMDGEGYVYNPLRPTLGPPEYPWGFPAVMAPVVFLFGNDMTALQVLMKLIYLALFLTVFGFLRLWLPWWVAAIGTIALAYNPVFIELRTEVMSDLPFALWVLLCLSMLGSRHRWATVGAVVAGTLAVLTREAGVALALGLLCTWMAMRLWPERCDHEAPPQRIGLVACFTLGAFIVQRLTAPAGYGHQFSSFDLPQVLATNIEYLTEVLAYRFFLHTYDHWHSLAIVGIALFALSVIIGFIITAKKSIRPVHLVLVAFLGLFMLFPFSARGFRFIVPFLPFLLLFGLMALRSIPRIGLVLAAALPLFILQQNHELLMRMVKSDPFVPEGPQRKEASEVFAYMNARLPTDARVLFIKPRALSLYTHRAAMCPPDDSLAVHLPMQIDTARISHIVLYDRLPDPVTEGWVAMNQNALKLNYDRSSFRIWAMR